MTILIIATFIFNYLYYFGYLVIDNLNGVDLYTLVFLLLYYKTYKIYYLNYIYNTDIDIIESDNIKSQIINNKNNIVIYINSKNITYLKNNKNNQCELINISYLFLIKN